MCTVTFIPRPAGYCLAMNRDEKIARPGGLAPEIMRAEGRSVAYPSEPGGGTWISLNDAGSCLALINGYSVRARVGIGALSRGVIVKAACLGDTREAVERSLEKLALGRVNPFRLIGIFARGKVAEWRWDLKELVRKDHRWRAQQWISSGFDEPKAQQIRSRTFRKMQEQESAGSLDWLSRVHRSHWPEKGPFSICMHRDDAMTVSSTRIIVSHGRGTMIYQDGPPCLATKPLIRELQLREFSEAA